MLDLSLGGNTEELKDEIESYYDENGLCDWCGKEGKTVPLRPWDENSVVYAVCLECKDKYNDELDEMEEF